MKRILGGVMLMNGLYKKPTNNKIMKGLVGENVAGYIKMLKIKWLRPIHRKTVKENVRTLTE